MHVGYSEILIILVKSNLTFALGAKKGNLGDPYSICLGQGNLVMGTLESGIEVGPTVINLAFFSRTLRP